MNLSPSPIASPIPMANPTSPICAALAAQIGVLTHVTDRLEQLAVVVPIYHDSVQHEIDELHATIDALNALYEMGSDLNAKNQWEIDSLNRRLRVNQQAAEKHHEGNRAACEREGKLRDALNRLLQTRDLNLTNMDAETYTAINEAKSLAY